MAFKTIITTDQAKAQVACETLMGPEGAGMFLREVTDGTTSQWISSGMLPDVSAWDTEKALAVAALYGCSDVSDEAPEVAMARLSLNFV